jgi:hypothetical protein
MLQLPYSGPGIATLRRNGQQVAVTTAAQPWVPVLASDTR